jgi:hypothetical protein
MKSSRLPEWYLREYYWRGKSKDAFRAIQTEYGWYVNGWINKFSPRVILGNMFADLVILFPDHEVARGATEAMFLREPAIAGHFRWLKFHERVYG